MISVIVAIFLVVSIGLCSIMQPNSHASFYVEQDISADRKTLRFVTDRTENVLDGWRGREMNSEPARVHGGVSTGHSTRLMLHYSIATLQPIPFLLRT